MKKKDLALALYKNLQTVFSVKELTLMFSEISYKNLKRRLNYLVKQGKLRSVRRGILVKESYSIRELVNKIYKPAYISLETVLLDEGINFQSYKSIFAVSYLNREIEVDGTKIVYRRLKDEVLLNSLGVIRKENCVIATKERAFLDAVYLYRNYCFDNLSVLDWKKVFDIAPIYKNKSFVKRVNSYYKIYKQENV
ncbi:hypothetical protein KKC08_03695 [Patescibacteria group bacterium]|nr:hypothetical protein [Patescibacteria group bacterium]MCG2702036.1 hypothetical protein [Candidatus Parcubacteria bacterium]MBU4265555.1 hypothetical protein [Patescibacteria group bacterium]MBU4389884.1 hypothetical protein [Patescibacteria group bacterium]MBU4397243.1 hypothetical protein [Patescibacteria group bacterium]